MTQDRPPTRLADVTSYLREHGCGGFGVGTAFGDDIYVLYEEGGRFHIDYVERGSCRQPQSIHDDEAEACARFVARILGFEHPWCVGIFASKDTAAALTARLEAEGLRVGNDAIPYGGWSDPRFRVFVYGTDLARAQALLDADLPLRD
jgi:hypothetical protein